MRISVSDAPGSYFFCARVAGDASAAASSAAIGTSLLFMVTSSFELCRSLSPARLGPLFCPFSRESHQQHANGAGDPRGHQIHEPDQEQAEDRPRGGLRDLVRDVRHELDE